MKNNKKSTHGSTTEGARPIWRRLVVLVIGLCALLGVANAGSLQKLLTGTTESTSASTTKLATQNVAPASLALNNTSQVVGETEPVAEINAPNIVDLISDSETIINGMVKEVTDGFENGVPYTQVTVQVSEALRGQVGEEYTFRQFGLVKPRRMENGKIYLGTTPAGWSKYEVGEDTMLFLYEHASQTGLQTTVGLGQGKVVFQGGNAVSQEGNEGLFENVTVDGNLLNDKDKRLLATKKGEVNADGFKSFVRRAVNGRWIEGGKLRHEKK
jgi:hypothetical protein